MVANISYEGVIRALKLLFPKGAIRQAVLNAIIHKDYVCSNPTQIKVFANKLSITHGGTLPDE